MTESLDLVVDFLKTKGLNRTCDLLHEEWRLHTAAGYADTSAAHPVIAMLIGWFQVQPLGNRRKV